jgi:ribose transport system permease protein
MSVNIKKNKSIISRFRDIRELNLLLIIIVVGAVLAILTPHFLKASNLLTTAIGFSADGIIVVGMTVALVSGGFDLSVGSVMGLAGVAAAVFFTLGINIWIACILALLIGAACGLFNGVFIGKVGLNPFITTLAMQGIARGLAYVLTEGSPISLSGVSASFKFIGSGNLLGIPIIVFLFVVIAIIGDFMLRKTEPLRKVFYTGSNEKAAVLSGINISNVKLGVYVMASSLAALAGILSIARFSVATPSAGTGAELRNISAAVIGGASLSGGEGTVFGSVLGVLLLNIINNGLVLLNVSVYWQDLINGLILIIAVTIDFLSHKKSIDKIKTKK